MVLSQQRQQKAVNEGLPEEVMFRLSSEHKLGDTQVNGQRELGESKGKGESWGWRPIARLGGLQLPVKELLILRAMGIHSMEVVM